MGGRVEPRRRRGLRAVVGASGASDAGMRAEMDGGQGPEADVGAAEAARLLGVTPYRFGRLARAGCVRPSGWYVNRYQAVVWRYPPAELRELAGRTPDGWPPPLPEGDARARLWRARRVEQLLRAAADPWERAAVWWALLGETADLYSLTPPEATHLARLAPTLWTEPRGWPPKQSTVTQLCTPQNDEESTAAQAELTAAVTWARLTAPPPPDTSPTAPTPAAGHAPAPRPTSPSPHPPPEHPSPHPVHTPPAPTLAIA
jgi:Family of unknown function (DUF6397)